MIFIILITAVIGALIGAPKGRAGLGFLLGFLFSIFGILAICFIEGDRIYKGYTCPHCKHPIDPRVSMCGVCRREVKPSIK